MLLEAALPSCCLRGTDFLLQQLAAVPDLSHDQISPSVERTETAANDNAWLQPATRGRTVGCLHVTVEVIKKGEILLTRPQRWLMESHAKKKKISGTRSQVLLLAFALDIRPLCHCFPKITAAVPDVREHQTGPYLEYVSLVEAEFVALCGTKRVKCHCFHAENSKHTHMHACAPSRRQNQTPVDAPARREGGGLDPGKSEFKKEIIKKKGKGMQRNGTGRGPRRGEVSSVHRAGEDVGESEPTKGKNTTGCCSATLP